MNNSIILAAQSVWFPTHSRASTDQHEMLALEVHGSLRKLAERVGGVRLNGSIGGPLGELVLEGGSREILALVADHQRLGSIRARAVDGAEVERSIAAGVVHVRGEVGHISRHGVHEIERGVHVVGASVGHTQSGLGAAEKMHM